MIVCGLLLKFGFRADCAEKSLPGSGRTCAGAAFLRMVPSWKAARIAAGMPRTGGLMAALAFEAVAGKCTGLPGIAVCSERSNKEIGHHAVPTTASTPPRWVGTSQTHNGRLADGHWCEPGDMVVEHVVQRSGMHMTACRGMLHHQNVRFWWGRSPCDDTWPTQHATQHAHIIVTAVLNIARPSQLL